MAGLICGMLTPFQYYAFAAAGLLSLMFFIVYHIEKRSLKGIENFLYFFIPCVIALPFFLTALTRLGGIGIRFNPGWEAYKNSALSFSYFYIANLGLPFVLALMALIVSKFKFRSVSRLKVFRLKEFPEVKYKLFLSIWILTMFLIPNLVSFSGTVWDMCKFFAYMWIPVCILAAAIIFKFKRIFWPALLIFSILSSVLILFWNAQSTWQGLSLEDIAAGEWIKNNVEELAVFSTYTQHNTPVEFSGRLRITGYSGWMYNFGLPFHEREVDLRTIYCGTPDEAVKRLKKYSSKYIILGPNERNGFKCPHQFTNDTRFRLIYDEGDIQIYKLIV